MNNITYVSLAVAGIVEAIKNIFPKMPTVLKTILSIVLSIAAGIGFCVVKGVGVLDTVLFTAVVVGMVQTCYNFLLKTLKNYAESFKNAIVEK